VLGDLPAKPMNTPSKQTNNREQSEAMKSYSPIKQMPTLSPQLLTNKENAVGADAWKAGRKRSIYEVDDTEQVECVKAMFVARDEVAIDAGRPAVDVVMKEHTVCASCCTTRLSRR
jgi:hypothetical protein